MTYDENSYCPDCGNIVTYTDDGQLCDECGWDNFEKGGERVSPVIVNIDHNVIRVKEDAPLSSIIKLFNSMNLIVNGTGPIQEIEQIEGVYLINKKEPE